MEAQGWPVPIGIAATLAALIAVLPAAGSMARDPTVSQDMPPGRIALDYVIRDGVLQTCKVRGSTGDADVDEAMCGLLRHCVVAGAATDAQAMACLAPRYARLTELVGAGLLATLDTVQLPDAASAPADAAPVVSPDPDIVVTARRTPKPGLWLVSEGGRRTMFAQDGMVFTLPRRNWRMCIRPGAVGETLASMIRFNPRGLEKPPCGWNVAVPQDGMIKGSLHCAVRGATLGGKMTGQFGDMRFTAKKETRYRQIAPPTEIQKHRRAVMEEFDEPNAGTEDDIYPRLDRIAMRRIPDSIRDRLEDNLDETSVTGFRIGDCPSDMR